MVNTIPKEEAAWIERAPTREEIKSAVWGCDPTKAPGVDGFNLDFIRKMWDEIGEEFCIIVEGFFESEKLPRGANMTWVTLIPKVEAATNIQEFRSISMVGSVYKVI